MSAKLGDIDYNENEYLNLGASYEEIEKQRFYDTIKYNRFKRRREYMEI